MLKHLRTAAVALIGAVALLPGAAAADTTERVSLDSAAAQALGGHSVDAAVSADGRFVAFDSEATNLVAGDSNGLPDVFVRDRLLGTTERVSVDSAEMEATGGVNILPSISADGRYVAFHSSATNLVAGDSNGKYDVFVRDRTLGTTERVSVDSAEVQVTGGDSFNASISADGQFVAFWSGATNLVAGDSNGLNDVFVRDLTLGTTERVSVDSAEAQSAMGDSYAPSISADGRYVAFDSYATNLVASDSNGQADIFLRDRTLGTTERVSLDSTGAAATTGGSFAPSVSSDGRFVAFESYATNLVAGDGNGKADIFVRDRMFGATERESVDDTGTPATGGDSLASSISDDGRFVAFQSDATNMVAGDSNGFRDIFVRDLTLGTTARVSVASGGGQASDGNSSAPAVSGNGLLVVYHSEATDLVDGDTNGMYDVFVSNADGDGDSVRDSDDNCPTVANASGQAADLDGDLAGDACDAAGTGNVDCNGAVNSVDSLKILRHSAGLSVVQSEPCKDIGETIGSGFAQGDTDCNGSVNSVDALKVLRAVAGLSVSSSCAGPVIGT